ncbi:replication initiation protein [Clostridium sp. FP2]|uniref:replication initiation protein n=1 Tax=Clostridium sp. FP2 TaxID=2724481 RepID=UPI0013E9997C|nr:replication initiation protein [Clostridium sp. FP2]MBZ9626416.1 replication initiation protein [Clostridium sp. FP2]
MKKGYVVTKSNRLISSGYDLSSQEQKIILTLASFVQPTDVEFKEYTFKIKDFIELLGLKDQSKYTEIPKITKELMKKVFEIKDGKKIIQLAWLCSVVYETGEGTVTLKFAPDLKPYLLQLKELYTSYRLENILSLKSKYSIRLYEILKSFQYKKQANINLEELKTMVGASANYFSSYADFKRRVLNKAQEEINEKTDITFKYSDQKVGRKVTSIAFNIKDKSSLAHEEVAVTTVNASSDIEIVKQIIKEDILELEAQRILDVANYDINNIKEKYDIVSQLSTVNNLVGIMITALKENWQVPKGKHKVSTFNDYEQRAYDFDELEKKLLGWDK